MTERRIDLSPIGLPLPPIQLEPEHRLSHPLATQHNKREIPHIHLEIN